LLAGAFFEGRGLEGILAAVDRSVDGFLSRILKKEGEGKKGDYDNALKKLTYVNAVSLLKKASIFLRNEE
ncbi:MAG: hypothetical protein AABX37_06065, partial [Nanoarchaeota archaeon]